MIAPSIPPAASDDRQGQRLAPLIRIVAIACLLLGILAACNPNASKDPRLQVVATTTQVEDLVTNVAGDLVRVHALMGPGTDPHLFIASEGDLVRLEQADLILYNGLHLEARLAQVLAGIDGPGRRSVAVTADIDPARLIGTGQFEGGYDPHVWFDLGLWNQALATVAAALVDADPGNSHAYRTNAANYRTQLAELADWSGEMLSAVPPQRRTLVTSHDAFGYFGRAWGFEVRGLQGISTATEAGAADVQRLANFLSEESIPAIFVESSVPGHSMQAVLEAAQARGHPVQIGGVLFSDALGPPATAAATFEGMYRANVATITEALS